MALIDGIGLNYYSFFLQRSLIQVVHMKFKTIEPLYHKEFNPAKSIDNILKGFGMFWVWKIKLLTKNWKFKSVII